MAKEIDIASDPRFSLVLTDPRFKAIPRRSRKVQIGSRFQSMFTDRKFRVKYGVDKRGRRVQQSSSEDLQKYYDLHDNDAVTSSQQQGNPPQKTRQLKSVPCSDDGQEGEVADGAGVCSLVYPHHESDEVSGSGCERGDSDSGSGSEGGDSDSSTDVEEVMAPRDPEVIHSWWDHEVSPIRSVETGSRLALCRMDWDRVSATDILVFLDSFKPQGGSVQRVTVLPSDFGLKRMKSEDIQGPTDLLDQSDSSVTQEGCGYSNERLRQYQLQRLNYYYAVVECDCTATADHLYEQCDGVEFEHCGGRLDLRFIPDDMSFDDREPKSVAIETSIPAGYTPPEFVTSALQQSKVQLTWDETDPRRLQTTMRKFSRDDLLQMDFDAYMASSSGESGSECGTPGEVGGRPTLNHSTTKYSNKATKYRSLLAGGADGRGEDSGDGEEGRGKGGGDGEEVMEISWKPGLKEGVEGMVRKRQEEEEGEGTTTWDHYIREKNKKKKEKRAKVKGKRDHGNDKEKEEKSQLELLMMEEGEEERKGHFSLDSILKQERGGASKKRSRRKKTQVPSPTDSFEVNVNDSRFSALYSNHLYAPDPSHPHYRATKGMAAIMKERRKRREKGGRMAQV